jgi:ribosomal protein L18E
VAKKIGRSMLIAIDDIPALLKDEDKKARRENAESTKKVLAYLEKSEKDKRKARLEKIAARKV